MSVSTKPSTTEQVAAFKAACAEHGWRFEASSGASTGDGVVTVTTSFAPGDTAAYVVADSVGYGLLSLVPVVDYGSTWGTEGSGVGGHAGLPGGYYRLSKSGCSKRFVKALSKGGAR